MHTGSKGWYVNELKKRGVTKIEDRYVENFKGYELAKALERKVN